MKQISITITETAHWHAMIGQAEHVARHLLPQGIEDYLIRLFLRAEQEKAHVIQAQEDIEHVVSAADKLQRLGDQCLMLCGFYPEACKEYGVGMDEFVAMGIESYKKMVSLEYGENEMIFEYLAENFVQLSNLLCQISRFSNKFVKIQDYKSVEGFDKFEIPFKQIEIPFSSPISYRVLN